MRQIVYDRLLPKDGVLSLTFKTARDPLSAAPGIGNLLEVIGNGKKTEGLRAEVLPLLKFKLSAAEIDTTACCFVAPPSSLLLDIQSRMPMVQIFPAGTWQIDALPFFRVPLLFTVRKYGGLALAPADEAVKGVVLGLRKDEEFMADVKRGVWKRILVESLVGRGLVRVTLVADQVDAALKEHVGRYSEVIEEFCWEAGAESSTILS
ncbi:hypothetical protein CC80DRAFT_495074 [Byssothecium circinans]|uniref:Uncharacterized protein n=1 Tax=Byssothecium circinans TaxID=147558 RepID=A0A6A5TL90_9PLEO|nr:hypothetical protein CC80DRAFT_495074 [Byssothecium circinans]